MATDALYPMESCSESGQVVEQFALLSSVMTAPFRSLPPKREQSSRSVDAIHLPVSFRREASHIPSTTFGVFSLYRYPAKFIPQAVAYVIDHYATQSSRVIDPFAGSGTTGLTAYLYGLDSELWDLNPLLRHIIQTSLMQAAPIKAADLLEEICTAQHEWLPDWNRLNYWYPESVLPVLRGDRTGAKKTLRIPPSGTTAESAEHLCPRGRGFLRMRRAAPKRCRLGFADYLAPLPPSTGVYPLF